MKAQKILLVLCCCFWAAIPESTEVEVKEVAVPREADMFQHNRLLQFLLGKRQTPHSLMHEQLSSSSRQSAVNQSVLDSEAMMAAGPTEEERDKRSLDNQEADAHLKRLGIMERKKRRCLSSVQDDSKRRASLVKEVLALTLREPESSLAGRQMKDCDSSEERLNVVKHCLGDKKTNTISSRISSIRSYFSWADKLVMTLEKDPDDSYKDKKMGARQLASH
jgi:hypothetical protein